MTLPVASPGFNAALLPSYLSAGTPTVYPPPFIVVLILISPAVMIVVYLLGSEDSAESE